MMIKNSLIKCETGLDYFKEISYIINQRRVAYVFEKKDR